ncbi:uncharacterized protein LOC142342571 [Convolutriloba macropyga]|uniref:uncharacterized protein LOC142342571 n=1 Tax=Convolutriloba macropyga TaxID=536237 RepID=UPI003F527C23
MNFNNLSNSISNSGQPASTPGSNVSPFNELMHNPESVHLLSQMLQDPSVRAKLHLPNHSQQPVQSAMSGTSVSLGQTLPNDNRWNEPGSTAATHSFSSGFNGSFVAQQSEVFRQQVSRDHRPSSENNFFNLNKVSGTTSTQLMGQRSPTVQQPTTALPSPAKQPAKEVSVPPPFPPPFLPPPLPPPGFPLSLLPPMPNMIPKPDTEVAVRSDSSNLNDNQSSSGLQTESREESSDSWISPRRKYPGNSSVRESRNSRAHAPYISPMAFESKVVGGSAPRSSQKATVEKEHWTTNAAVKHLQKSSEVLAQFAKSLNQTPVSSILPMSESSSSSTKAGGITVWPKEEPGSNCIIQEMNQSGHLNHHGIMINAQRKKCDEAVASSVSTRNASSSMCGMSFPETLPKCIDKSADRSFTSAVGPANASLTSSDNALKPTPFPCRSQNVATEKPAPFRSQTLAVSTKPKNNVVLAGNEPSKVSKPPFQPIKRTASSFQGDNGSNSYTESFASRRFNGGSTAVGNGLVHDDDRYESLISCDPCNKVFWTKRSLEEHKFEHSKCPHPGCSFSANEEAVENHFANTHARGIHLKLDTPEEIRKWREQRRKHFPTKANIEVKMKQQLAKQSRGETIETVSYSNCKARGQNNARNNGPNDGSQQNGESHQVKHEITNNSGFSRPPRLTSRQKYLSKFTRPGDAPKRPKFIEIKKEESDSEDSDAPPMEIPTGKVDPINVPAPSESGNRNERSPVKEVNNNETVQRTYKPRPRKATLLEMLLAPDIRHERNVLMQCMYYIEQNKFFS